MFVEIIIDRQHLWRVDLSFGDRCGQFLMIHTARQHAAAAVPVHYSQLRQHIFAAMLERQVAPKAEAAHGTQFGGVEQHGRRHPCYFISAWLVCCDVEALLHMQHVRGVMKAVAFPLRCARQHTFGLNRTVPKFDRLLVRTHIVGEA